MKVLLLSVSLVSASVFPKFEWSASAREPRCDAPTPERATDVTQFDFMLGDWTSSSRWMQADQTYQEVTARHCFARAFGDQGLVDDNFKVTDAGEHYWGTAIRTYDPKQDLWTCRWYDGELRSWASEFTLRAVDNGLVGEITGSDSHGNYTDRIQFTPVDEATVKWSMVRRYVGLATPITIGQIEYRRSKTTAGSR